MSASAQPQPCTCLLCSFMALYHLSGKEHTFSWCPMQSICHEGRWPPYAGHPAFTFTVVTRHEHVGQLGRPDLVTYVKLPVTFFSCSA